MIEQLKGQAIGRYQIIDLLGEGGMGMVFQGQDANLKRAVAIKIMHPHFARRAVFRDRFLQEARTTANLDHPGIVKVFDSGFDQTRTLLYFVMEFIPGGNLRQRLQTRWQKGQWLPLTEALQLTHQICLAVDYAHRQGVLHRDLKPDNVMLKKNEPEDKLPYRSVLTDLGLAKLVEGSKITQEGTTMGTPAYMSPEQALGQATDARSDVYSLGVLLYELTVGRRPFPIQSITEAVRYHSQEAPPPPRTVYPDFPPALEKVILTTLAKEPGQRFGDAAALAEAIDQVLPGIPTELSPPTALAGAVSLMTEFQESLIPSRGPSLLDALPTPPSDLREDRLTVMTKDDQKHFVSLTTPFTVGRSPDNNLKLDDPRASRQHARIEFDGSNYTVIDLDSSNGTYLAQSKLLPGVPQVWTPEQVLRIGKTYFRLERGQQQPPSPIVDSDGTLVNPSALRSSPGEGRVVVFMEPDHLTVEPDHSLTITLTILNQGAVVDHFEISVQGIPSEWVTISPARPELLPSQQVETTILIQPPRSVKSQAKDYNLTVRVVSQDDPDQVVEILRSLTVQPFYQFNSALNPERITAGESAKVVIENQSNIEQTFEITWQDRANELVFRPAQVPLTVAEGGTATMEFQASPRQSRLLGGSKIHPISVQINPTEGTLQTRAGEVISRATVSFWALSVMLLLCVALSGLGAFFYNEQQIAQQTTETVNAQSTATELAALNAQAATATTQADQTAMAAAQMTETAIAQATSTAQVQATQAAIVEETATAVAQETSTAQAATATWKATDSDDDGLTNEQELALGTNPDNGDSDGDDILDGQDDHPLQTSTPTATPTNTSTPTPTPRPTATPSNTPTPIPQIKTAIGGNNIRSGPGENYPVIIGTALPRETPFPVIGKNEDWVQIQLSENSNGWVWVGDTSNVETQNVTVVPFVQAPPTPTPTPTFTPIAPPQASIIAQAEDETLNQGDCTELVWDIQNVKEVYLDEQGVDGEAERKVCPASTTTYTWRILKNDGTEESRSVTIQVATPTTPPVNVAGTAQAVNATATAQQKANNNATATKTALLSRRLNIVGDVYLVDDETFGSDEKRRFTVDDFVVLNSTNNIATYTNDWCVGDEVRLELRFQVSLDKSNGAIDINNGIAEYYEGTSCSTNDLEKRKNFNFRVGPNNSQKLSFVLSDSDGKAEVDLIFINNQQ